MKSLNKKLFVVLAILLLVAGSVSAISAYSDNGTGVIDDNPGGDNYTSAGDVASEVYYDNNVVPDSNDTSTNSGSGSSVSLTEYPTANPVLLLLGSVTLAGICFANRKI